MGQPDKLDIPPGTLELMILTILAREPLHGYGVSQRLGTIVRMVGSVRPAFLRIESAMGSPQPTVRDRRVRVGRAHERKLFAFRIENANDQKEIGIGCRR